MQNIIYQPGVDYEDLGESVEIKLYMIGGWIFLETPIERVAVNQRELREDGIPRNVLTYVINTNPNKNISITDLKKAGIVTSRDLRQIAIKAGIKSYTRAIFMPVCTKDILQSRDKVTLRSADTDAVMQELYY